MEVFIISKNRVVYIDILKIVAIFGVVLIHASGPGFSMYEILTKDWYSSVFWGSIVRWSVPIFFMCSGALFLDSGKEISIKNIYFKYIKRLLIVLTFWALLYEFYDVIYSILIAGSFNNQTIITGIINVLTGNTHFHLYFLYIIIFIYALIPLLKAFVTSAYKKQIEYFLLLWFILAVLYPFICNFYPFNLLGEMVLQYKLNLTYGCVGYFVAGHYFNTYGLNTKTKLIIYALGLFGFFVTFFGTIILTQINKIPVEWFYEGMSPGVALMSLALFVFCKYLFENKNISNKRLKSITILSNSSFGIYLVHDFFNMIFRSLGFTISIFNPFFSIVFVSIVIFTLSFLVSYVFSKIPILRKYIL